MDLCRKGLCRCVNRLITKFWMSNSFSWTRQALCFCNSLQQFLLEDLVNFARTSSGYVVPEVVWFTESRHISRNSNSLDVSAKLHIFWRASVFSTALQHITADEHIAEQISRLRSIWSQAAVLSTCNRFVLYFASPEQKSWTWLKISWVLICSFRHNILHPVIIHAHARPDYICIEPAGLMDRCLLLKLLPVPHSAAVPSHTFSWSRPGALHRFFQLLGTLRQQSVPFQQQSVRIHHIARSPPPTCRVSVRNSLYKMLWKHVQPVFRWICAFCTFPSFLMFVGCWDAMLALRVIQQSCISGTGTAFVQAGMRSDMQYVLEFWLTTDYIKMAFQCTTLGFSHFLSHWFSQGPPPQHTDRSLGARHATSAGGKPEPQAWPQSQALSSGK